jgi:ATP-dependent Clp protease adapter protein ClpS
MGICWRANKLAAKAILVSALFSCQIPAPQPIAMTIKADTVATMRFVIRAVKRLFKRFNNKDL